MLVYPWNDLFTGNQQVYFLWAANEAGFGNFQADPLLAQADPYPIFTFLVRAVFTALPIGFFHVVYWLLNSVYSFAIFGIADRFTGIYQRFRTTFVFSILFLALHSAEIWGTFFNALTGHDIRWVWESGLAEQGVLRGYLQPSAFGVFLLLGFYQFIQKKWVVASCLFAIAAVFHANYLILGWAALCMAFLYLIIIKKVERSHWKAAGVFGLITIPYAIYLGLNFLPDSQTMAAVSGHLEGNPHLDPSTWLNLKTALQLTLFGVAVFFLRKTQIGKWLTVAFGISALASVLAFLLPHSALLSLNPWRVTVVIFPVSFAILLGLVTQALRPGNYIGLLLMPLSVVLISLLHLRLFGSADPEKTHMWQMATLTLMGFSLIIGWLMRKLPKGFLTQVKNTMALGMIMLLIASGVVGKFIEKRTLKEQPWAKAARFVCSHSQPGDLYLIPPHLNNFRMNAGVAIVADPLVVHGSTLADQFERQKLANQSFVNDEFDAGMISQFKGLTITHVLTANPSVDQKVIYEDTHFAIIELK